MPTHAPRRDRRAGQEQLRAGALRRPDRPGHLHGSADQREAARQGRRHGASAPSRPARRWSPAARRSTRATSIPRRCSPTSTPTARSPRRRSSGRCSSSSPTRTTTTPCGSPTTRSTGCPARCSAARTARSRWPAASAPAPSPSTAACTSPRQPVRRLQAVRHRPGDGRGRARGVPGAQDLRDGRHRCAGSGVMSRPLEGIRVLEVAMYGFVPSAGAVLGRVGRRRHQGRARRDR